MSISKSIRVSLILKTLAVTLTGFVAVSSTHAATQAVSSGFYKVKLGEVTVIALSDGVFALPAEQIMVEAHKGEVNEALTKAHAAATVPTSVNAFLIDTGAKRILIDTGSGAFLGPTLGEVEEHLEAAGYQPGQIDEVLITHLHADHAGGLINKGQVVYPNATVRVDENEARFWQDRTNIAKVDPSVQGTFDAVEAALTPYAAAGHLKMFHAGEQLEPGITAVSEPGHTPGHTGYRVESDGQVLLVWGDLVHLAMVQLPDPKVTIKFDSAPADAIAAREKALSDAAQKGYLVAAAHVDFPGIGKVSKTGRGYVWTPVKP
jgi:glyoxylase-like metal-dependent hydrolase (beta-lactamase superfamily II)